MEKRDWARLADPFKPEEIEWRIGRAGETNGKVWAMCLAYVTARAIMDRLDSVIGPDNWRVSYHLLGSAAEKIDAGVICRLEIRCGSEWIAKEDGSEQTEMESFKGGISGALKRAAVLFGVGRYLYGLPEGFAEIVERGNGAQYAKTKDGKPFYWQPPELPDWALPSRQLKEEDGLDQAPKSSRVLSVPARSTPTNPVSATSPAPKPGPAAVPKELPKPNSSEKSKPMTPPLATGMPSSLPNPSSRSVGKPATPSPSPFAKGEEKSDLKRDQLNNKLANLYRPYLAKFPNAHFTEILKERYKVDETKLMTTAQISDLVTFMEEGINVTPPTPVKTGKPPTDTERKDLWEASKSNGWTAAQMTLYLKAAFKVASSKTLSREQFQLLSSVSPCTPFEIAYAEVAPQEDMP